MKKIVSSVLVFVSLAAFLATSSLADEQTVNATVTPLVLSIELSETTISYGTLQAGDPEVSSTPPFFKAFNRGSVAMDFDIKGANSNNGWTIGNTPGEDQFVHRFTTGSTYTELTTSYQALASDVAIDGDVQVYTKLTMPTTITNSNIQTLPIVIRGSMHTP